MDAGTIAKTCAILASLIRGAIHDRHTLAKDFDVQLAAADRYVRHLETVPGVVSVKLQRRRAIRWNFGVALREAGL
jgi:hypothetical protein